jgi:MOSC domain-containing protein YiiM
LEGVVVQVSVSRGGIPKRAIAEGRITIERIEGDSWAHPRYHGGPNQAVLLIAEEALEYLKDRGFPVFPGALGENITMRGIDPRQLRAGQVFRIGGARLELTKVRVPCDTIEVYGTGIGNAVYDAKAEANDASSPVWAFSGFYAKVLSEGIVRSGDSISLESVLA